MIGQEKGASDSQLIGYDLWQNQPRIQSQGAPEVSKPNSWCKTKRQIVAELIYYY